MRRSVDRAGLAQELQRLPDLDAEALRRLWHQLTRTTAPPLRQGLLVRLVAQRLQERALGGLPARSRRALAQAVAGLAIGQPAATQPDAPRAGTQLLRVWRGTTYEVTVLEKGVLYKGEVYRSLSKVALLITGANWNGPAFFGLRRPVNRQKAER